MFSTSPCMLWRENAVKIGSNCTFVYFPWKKKVGTSCSSISTFGLHFFTWKVVSLISLWPSPSRTRFGTSVLTYISEMIIFFFGFSSYFGGNYSRKMMIFPHWNLKKIPGGLPPPPPTNPQAKNNICRLAPKEIKEVEGEGARAPFFS